VTGDFNEVPGSFVYEQFAGRGWTDAYLEAGLPECDAATGEGCTSGREDSNLSEMESPESNQRRRIDFLFVVPEESASCELDPEFTRIFTDDPNPFAPSCGAAPHPSAGLPITRGCRWGWIAVSQGARSDLVCPSSRELDWSTSTE
jgi:hypothetical protein